MLNQPADCCKESTVPLIQLHSTTFVTAKFVQPKTVPTELSDSSALVNFPIHIINQKKLIMKKAFVFLLASSLFMVACNSDKKDESTNKTESASADNKDASTSAASKAEKNRQTALASVMAFNTHDVDAIMKDATADAVDYGDGSGAPMKNGDSVKGMIKAWVASFPDVKGENLEAFSNADGSKVIVVGVWSGTFKNDLMGMKATGKSYKVWDGDLFTFNDEGKITSHRGIQSGATPMMQVGAKMK